MSVSASSIEMVPRLDDYATHLCLVSGQAAANLIPIVICRPRNVILLVTEQMRQEAVLLQNTVKRVVPNVHVEMVAIPNGWDLQSCQELFAASAYRYADDKPLFNVTGGTKLLAFAALNAAYDLGIPAIYLNEDDGTISVLSLGSNRRSMRLPAVPFKLSLQNYLAAYGCTVEVPRPFASLSREKMERLKVIASSETFREVIPRLNGLALEAQDKQISRISCRDQRNSPMGRAFDSLCEYFCDLCGLRLEKDFLSFPDEKTRFFVAGGWLEEYVANVMSSIGKRTYTNIQVNIHAKNELDVAFYEDGFFNVIECKTCRMDDRERVMGILNKLSTLRRFGGNKTRLFLVSYQQLDEISKDRAKDLKIKVIDGRKILRLKDMVSPTAEE